MLRYRIDTISVNVEKRELKVGDHVIRIEPQAFDVLTYLLRHRHKVVSQDELLEKVWKTQFVSETAVAVRIKQLRKELGDNGRDQRIIRTYRGKGYRIVADVIELEGEPNHSAVSVQDPPGYSNLPYQRKEIIGRESDLERVIKALDRSSLVTLIGPGGVGKTTLTIAVGYRCAGFQKVVLCELAGSTEETLPDVILGSLDESAGSKEVTTTQIVEQMGDGHILLILDNCEQIIEAVVELSQCFLDGKADLTILATSREAFGIDLEQVILLEGLDTSSNESDAVALFTSRASSNADLTIPDSDLFLVQKIVSQLRAAS